MSQMHVSRLLARSLAQLARGPSGLLVRLIRVLRPSSRRETPGAKASTRPRIATRTQAIPTTRSTDPSDWDSS